MPKLALAPQGLAAELLAQARVRSADAPITVSLDALVKGDNKALWSALTIGLPTGQLLAPLRTATVDPVKLPLLLLMPLSAESCKTSVKSLKTQPTLLGALAGHASDERAQLLEHVRAALLKMECAAVHSAHHGSMARRTLVQALSATDMPMRYACEWKELKHG